MNIIKKAAFGLIEKTMTREGRVSDVRIWDSGTLYEVDVYMPDVDVSKWKSVMHMKCKVAEYTYRDYTPACWDETTSSCTLFIETGHDGPGTSWAKGLKTGDPVIFGVAHAAHAPAKPGDFLCLGDGSALGHFLALDQLTASRNQVSAVVFFDDMYNLPEQVAEKYADFQFVPTKGEDSLTFLVGWCNSQDLSKYSFIYLAGRIMTVSALRKQLKTRTDVTARIHAQGFWS